MQLQLAQVLSALSKAPISLSPQLLQAARRRMHLLLSAGGFQHLFEVAMLLNAVVKIKVRRMRPVGVYTQTDRKSVV